MRRWYWALVAALVAAGTAGAQDGDGLGMLFNPRLGEARPRVSTAFDYACQRRVDEQGTSATLAEYGVSAFMPLQQDPAQEWALLAGFDAQDIDSAARFPRSRLALPEALYDVKVGALHRRRLNNDWIGSAMLTFVSASDEPFHSGDELGITALATVTIPAQGRDAWLLGVHWSNTRSFLPWIPIPAVSYAWNPGESFRAVVGAPASNVFWAPAAGWECRASFFFMRQVAAEISYDLTADWQIYTRFDWGSENYFRAGRADEDDRIFYDEKEVALGLRWAVTEQLTLDCRGGYGFERYFFEGEDYDDDADRISLEDGWFTGLRASVTF